MTARPDRGSIEWWFLLCYSMQMGAVNIPGNLFYVHPLPDYLLDHHANPDGHTHIVYRDHRSGDALRKITRQRRQATEQREGPINVTAESPPPIAPIVGHCDVAGELWACSQRIQSSPDIDSMTLASSILSEFNSSFISTRCTLQCEHKRLFYLPCCVQGHVCFPTC